MKKLKDNFIVKLVIALITIAIMGVIIYFVFNYYTDVAKNKDNSKEEDNTSSNEDNNNDYEFIEYDNKKTRIFLNKTPFYLEILSTDGGKVISINDNALADFKSDLKIKYLIQDDLLILVTTDQDNNINSIAIFNENEDLLTYKNAEMRCCNYNISKPLINERLNDALVIRDNKIYITYTLEQKNNKYILRNNKYLDDIKESDYKENYIDKDTDIEYFYEISNKDGKLLEKLTFLYKLEDYLKK